MKVEIVFLSNHPVKTAKTDLIESVVGSLNKSINVKISWDLYGPQPTKSAMGIL